MCRAVKINSSYRLEYFFAEFLRLLRGFRDSAPIALYNCQWAWHFCHRLRSPLRAGAPEWRQVQSSYKNEWFRVGRRRAFRVGLLFFTTVVLGCSRVQAENLEAGKSGPKLFSSNCATCHSDPRTLSKRMNHWALTGFLREHYTASQTAAYELAAYLIAVDNHSPRGKQHSMARDNEPQQSWANQLSAPVERPPESIPTR